MNIPRCGTWPSSRPWPIIQDVFEDNVVSADEMKMLSLEIAAVEEMCADITDRANQDKPEFDLSEIRVSPLEVPVVQKTV